MNKIEKIIEFIWEFILCLGAYLLILAGVFGLLSGYAMYGMKAIFIGFLFGLACYLIFK